MTDKRKGSSETIRAICTEDISNINTLSKNRYNDNNDPQLFKDWLAGLIDASGCFLVSKNRSTSCEITVSEKQLILLTLVKRNVGGTIQKRSGSSAFRWRLHNRPGMLNLLFTINSRLLLPRRCDQFKTVCKQFNFLCLERNHFSSDNAWLAGFFEFEGYFRVNKTNLQLGITLTQKEKGLLQDIANEMGGRIYYDKSWDGWLYSASSKNDIAKWIKYFSRFPLVSWKQIQLFRFKKILLYKSRGVHLSKDSKSWLRFKRLVCDF